MLVFILSGGVKFSGVKPDRHRRAFKVVDVASPALPFLLLVIALQSSDGCAS